MPLEIATFTGVDARTSLDEVRAIQERYPKTEFGILVGSKTFASTDNRFPPLPVVDKWRISGIGLSLHLCGQYSRAVTNEDYDMLPALRLSAGFERAQVNAVEYPDMERIEKFAEAAPVRSVVLQRRSAEHPPQHPQIEYLFDKSGGRGTEGFEHWPEPEKEGRCGYAGGISPDNAGKAMEFIDRHSDRRTWIDMESGVRTDDWFDLDKVREVCRIVFG